MAERSSIMARFLGQAGWGAASRSVLAGDASFRRYDRLQQGGTTAVLMDAPPPMEDVRPFVRIAGILLERGLSAPRIMAQDIENGFLLLEDLGDDLFSRVISRGGDERLLYEAAIDALAHLHASSQPDGVPPYDENRLLAEVDLLIEWFMPARFGGPVPEAIAQEYRALWRSLFKPALPEKPVLVLRDYHADNLLWLPQRPGVARVGQLDFQDALMGSPAYDLVSLLEDARRDVSPGLAADMLVHYCHAAQADHGAIEAAYNVLGAQRNAKIVGIFTRLWKRDGKTGYLKLLPRVWRLLEADLARPLLAPMKQWFDRNIPPDARAAPLPGSPA